MRRGNGEGVSEAVAPMDSGTILMVLCGDKAHTYLFLVEWEWQRQMKTAMIRKGDLADKTPHACRRATSHLSQTKGADEERNPFFNSINK